MIWGYKIGSGATPLPIKLDIKSFCHLLLVGSSGSGKSFALLFLLGSLLKDNPTTNVYFLDFKSSPEFKFLAPYKHFYSGDDCYQGLLDYYQEFCDARKNGTSKTRAVLIWDEYPAAIAYYTNRDKLEKTKYASEILNIISEILMLGRGNGAGFGCWICCQRPDSTLFNGGSRENFMIYTVLASGGISPEMKRMVLPDEIIPDRIYQKGEGLLKAEGHALMEVKFPWIRNMVDWRKHILSILCKDNTI